MGWTFPSPHGDQDALPTNAPGNQTIDIPQVMLAGLGSAQSGAGSAAKAWRNRIPDKITPVSSVAAGSTLWTPGGSPTRKARLLRGYLFCTAAGSITLTDGNGGTTLAVIPVAASVPTSFDLGIGVTATTSVYYAAGGPGSISGTLLGVEE